MIKPPILSFEHFNRSLKPLPAKAYVHNLVHNGCITKGRKIWKRYVWCCILDIEIEKQKSFNRKKQINLRSGNL